MAALHPNYKPVKVIMTNGEEFETRSTAPTGADSTMNLYIDKYTHPAWRKTNENYVNASANEIAKFNDKFGKLNFLKKNSA